MNYSTFKQNLYPTKMQNELFILEFIFFPKGSQILWEIKKKQIEFLIKPKTAKNVICK